MAIELITQVWCDAHLQSPEGEERVDGTTIPPVTMPDGTQRVMDLCEACKKEISYGLLLDLLEMWGREPDHVAPMKQRGRKSESMPPDQLHEPCRWCTRRFVSVRGRRRHEQMMHVEAFEKAEAEALGLTLDEEPEEEPEVEVVPITVTDELFQDSGWLVFHDDDATVVAIRDRAWDQEPAGWSTERVRDHAINNGLGSKVEFRYACDYQGCDKWYGTYPGLRSHKSRSHKEATAN